jgi:hypothetical protein
LISFNNKSNEDTSKQLTIVVLPFMAILFMSMSMGTAYAHNMEVVGDYKIEIGWDQEPPIQGIKNSIEFIVTHATEADRQMAEAMDIAMEDDESMAHDDDHTDETDMTRDDDHDHEGGISGLEDTIQITVTLNDQTTTLNLVETDLEGMYLGEFTPHDSGYPVVHLSGMIIDTDLDLDMHPEMVESLSIISPLKQMSLGIEPNDVQCKEGLTLFMRTHEDSVICASNALGERLMSLGVVEY